MKKIIRFFYYVSLFVICFFSLLLVFLNGNREKLINFENRETKHLLIFIVCILILVAVQFLNQKMKLISLVLSCFLLVFFLIKIIPVKNYLDITWISLTILANIFMIFNIKYSSGGN